MCVCFAMDLLPLGQKFALSHSFVFLLRLNKVQWTSKSGGRKYTILIWSFQIEFLFKCSCIQKLIWFVFDFVLLLLLLFNFSFFVVLLLYSFEQRRKKILNRTVYSLDYVHMDSYFMFHWKKTEMNMLIILISKMDEIGWIKVCWNCATIVS